MRRTLLLVVTVAVVAAVVSAVTTKALMDRESDKPLPCAEPKAAFEKASQDVQLASSRAETWARTHTMVPPATSFPELQQSVAIGDEADTWTQMLTDLRYNVRVVLQVVDDSPACFSASDVAQARALLD